MAEAKVRPTLLSAPMAAKALADQSFYEKVPEYLPLKQKVTQMHIDLKSGRGCSSCKKRRIQRSLFSDFVTTLKALSPDGLERVKGYFGAQALMLQWRDGKTRQQKVRIL
jgi:hypothetical protein